MTSRVVLVKNKQTWGGEERGAIRVVWTLDEEGEGNCGCAGEAYMTFGRANSSILESDVVVRLDEEGFLEYRRWEEAASNAVCSVAGKTAFSSESESVSEGIFLARKIGPSESS